MNEPHPWMEPTRTTNPDETKPVDPTAIIAPSAAAGDKLLGRYQVLEPLGQGGMGAVFRCHDMVTGTDVAIKVLHEANAGNPAQMENLKANFALVERLHHPNIAALKTLEVDPATRRLFLIMEFVPGIPLQQYLEERGGRLEPAHALDILGQLADALDYGHSEKIVHRDVKPSNVLLDMRGRVKLLDFGIAERVGVSARTGPTGKPLISGTAAFMAPEQWRGQHQDGRTDQYALAALACVMLNGRPPAPGPNPDTIRDAVLAGAYELPADWPASRRQVVLRALSADLNNRHASCEAFVTALAESYAHSDVATRSPPVLSRWRRVAVITTVVCGLALGAWFVSRDNTPVSVRATDPVPAPARESALAPAVPLPRYSALVIGISAYGPHRQDGWNDLITARNDARDVAETLANDYGFTVTSLLDEQATRANIMQALDQLARQNGEDAVLIYFAGHGYYEEAMGEGYWIPHDARRTRGDTLARDEWLWNSTITKMLGASAARHILVVADACYGGALFRGEAATVDQRQWWWYQRALETPSRLLITSGDMEPVLDSGVRNSVFCSTLLNYLKHPAQPVFSASDLGQALKSKVGELTGQMVRFGQLPVPAHAGGEFVFVRKGASLPATAAAPAAPTAMPSPVSRDWTEDAEDVLALNQLGATNSAQRLAERISASSSAAAMWTMVDGYVKNQERQTRQQHIRSLIAEIQERAARTGTNAPARSTTPFITLLGPESAQPEETGAANAALMYRLLLEGELNARSARVVSRQDLEANLEELNLGTSDLADPSAQLALRRLLPASYLISGHLFREADGDLIMLRLVETETSRVLHTFSAQIAAASNRVAAIQRLADEIAAKTQPPPATP